MIWWYQSLIFPYTRLELFASYFRGNAMSKVVTALQDGVKLMELFGWSRKKKISLWLTNPGWWLSFLLHKIISIMSFFLSPLHSTETFWSHVLHFMPWKLSFPHFQTFFFFVTCNSSLLLTHITKIDQLQSLKPIYILYPKSQNTLLVTNI